MKVKIVITLLIIAPAVMFALELLDPWPQTVPQALVGTWQGETESLFTDGTKGAITRLLSIFKKMELLTDASVILLSTMHSSGETVAGSAEC
jgi:hypothetical protein